MSASYADLTTDNETTTTTSEASGIPVVAGSLQGLVILLIFFFSVIGNAAVILLIIRHVRLRTVTNAFITSLSISNFLQALLCIPFSFFAIIFGDWIFGDSFCIANGFFNSFFGIGSCLMITLITMDRYYAIVKLPQLPISKVSKKRASILLTFVWIYSFLLSFPWFIIAPQDWYHKQGFVHCMYNFHSTSSNMSMAYSVCLIIFGFLLPFTITSYCALKIWKTLRSTDTRIRPPTTQVCLLRFNGELRTATTVLIMSIFMICCWLPYCIIGLNAAAQKVSPSYKADSAAIYLAWSNGALNPLIYALRNPMVAHLLRRNRKRGYKAHSSTVISPDVKRRITSISVQLGRANANGTHQNWARKSPVLLFCTEKRKYSDNSIEESTRTRDTQSTIL